MGDECHNRLRGWQLSHSAFPLWAAGPSGAGAAYSKGHRPPIERRGKTDHAHKGCVVSITVEAVNELLAVKLRHCESHKGS
jgi:hypothetical protein